MRKVVLKPTEFNDWTSWAWFHTFIVLNDEVHAVIEYSDGSVDILHATEVAFDGESHEFV